MQPACGIYLSGPGMRVSPWEPQISSAVSATRAGFPRPRILQHQKGVR